MDNCMFIKRLRRKHVNCYRMVCMGTFVCCSRLGLHPILRRDFHARIISIWTRSHLSHTLVKSNYSLLYVEIEFLIIDLPVWRLTCYTSTESSSPACCADAER